jgi:hypothetical protein
VNLGSVNGFMQGAVASTLIGINHDMVDNIVRVGINYRFGGDREVVVKYP